MVDVEQTGAGITPIISLDYKVSEKLNIALKYEMATKLELETHIIDGKDGNGLYNEGDKIRSDMPAYLMGGLTLKPIEKLLLSTGIHYYFDKNADYGRTKKTYVASENGLVTESVKNEDILNNTIEFALGAEYTLFEKLSVSAGWLRVNSGTTPEYQTDLSHHMSSNTFGGGLEYRFNPVINLNLGVSYSMYEQGKRTFDHYLGATPMPVNETYDRDVLIFAVGVNINLAAMKK